VLFEGSGQWRFLLAGWTMCQAEGSGKPATLMTLRHALLVSVQRVAGYHAYAQTTGDGLLDGLLLPSSSRIFGWNFSA
jgi:hypothetical protein